MPSFPRRTVTLSPDLSHKWAREQSVARRELR